MTPINNLINPTPPIRIPLREIQPSSGTSHPGCWKSQNVEWETKTRMEKNNGGARNTALAKASGYITIQKTTGSGPAPHQAAEEELSHFSRGEATRS